MRILRHSGVKKISKCSFTICKLRFFNYFCLALTKNTHRTKASFINNEPDINTALTTEGLDIKRPLKICLMRFQLIGR